MPGEALDEMQSMRPGIRTPHDHCWAHRWKTHPRFFASLRM